MAAINKIGFNYDVMSKRGENWESPEDIIHYVKAGLSYITKTSGKTEAEIIDRRNRWIEYMKQALDCLEVIE